MLVIVIAVLAGATPAALFTGWLLRWSGKLARTAHLAELAAEPIPARPAQPIVRDGAVRNYLHPAQRAPHPAHPAVRPEGLTFDEAVEQALRVVNGDDGQAGQDEERPQDPSHPDDPTTMPWQHSANCPCGRCRTSARAAKPTGHPPGCGGLTAGEAALESVQTLWAGLSTDHQMFALLHDLLLDRPAPASLTEPSFR